MSLLNNNIPQFMLRSFGGFSSVAGYSVAVTVATALNVVQSGFNTFWTPYVFKNHDTNQHKIKQMHGYIVTFMPLLGILIVLFQNAIFLVVNRDYTYITQFLPFLILTPLCYTIGETTCVGIALKLKTSLNIVIYGVCAAINAQGELYLTDCLAYYAEKNEAVLYEVKNADDMLTYSTKPDLRQVSKHFMRYASEFIDDIRSGRTDELFSPIYGPATQAQKERYIVLLERFISAYGDKKVLITRAPGRLNLMGRHIDHRGGVCMLWLLTGIRSSSLPPGKMTCSASLTQIPNTRTGHSLSVKPFPSRPTNSGWIIWTQSRSSGGFWKAEATGPTMRRLPRCGLRWSKKPRLSRLLSS